MKKPWFKAQGPANIEIKDCFIDGENYSGTLTKQAVPGGFICGYPVTEVAHLLGAIREYRMQNRCVHYTLGDSFQLLRDFAERAEKKALDWEAKCRLKDEEIERLRAAKKRMSEYIGAYLSEEVKS